MIFALDFDDTFTADPDFWTMFIHQAKGFGHTTVIVTARKDTPESRIEINSAIPDGIHVVYTNWSSKYRYCRLHGVHIDIWIDDDPRSVWEGLENPGFKDVGIQVRLRENGGSEEVGRSEG